MVSAIIGLVVLALVVKGFASVFGHHHHHDDHHHYDHHDHHHHH